MYNPISPKVVAGAVGAGTGSVLATLILWVVGVVFYGIPASADRVSDAMAVVPSPIAGVVALLLTVAGAAGSGYRVPDALRDPSENPNVVAYETPSGLVVAGEASPVPTGTPVDVIRNPAIPLDDELGDEDGGGEPQPDPEELGEQDLGVQDLGDAELGEDELDALEPAER